MADAEFLDVGQDLLSIREGEVLVELEPVSGGGQRPRQVRRGGGQRTALVKDRGTGPRQGPAGRQDAIDGTTQFASPIRVPHVWAGQIRLVDLGEHVLELQRHQHGRRLGGEAKRRLERRIDRHSIGLGDVRMMERLGELDQIDDAILSLLARLFRRVDLELFAQIGVKAFPPTGEGWKVVRRDGS